MGREVEALLEEPWDNEPGRPKALSLRETISLAVCELTWVINSMTVDYRPDAASAKRAVAGTTMP